MLSVEGLIALRHENPTLLIIHYELFVIFVTELQYSGNTY